MYKGPGIYRHYKGGAYEAIGVAIREESKEEQGDYVREVVYLPLSPGSLLEDMDDVQFWARRLEVFNDQVVPPDRRIVAPRFAAITCTNCQNTLTMRPAGSLLVCEVCGYNERT